MEETEVLKRGCQGAAKGVKARKVETTNEREVHKVRKDTGGVRRALVM